MFTLLIEQTSNQLYRLARSNLTLYLDIFIYIICSTILTKCFTSFLLNIYFIQNPSLFVETLEDIISKPNLFIAGRVGLKEISTTKPKIYEILFKRLLVYEKSLNINTQNFMGMRDQRIQRDVLKRKAVFIVNTMQAQVLKNVNPFEPIMDSPKKYNLLLRFSFVTKNAQNFTQIYRMYAFMNYFDLAN